jgi:RES domain-containing protein
VKLWRIASAGPHWTPDDLSGAGAASSPGRWNNAGEFVLYTAHSLALAILETAAHVDDSMLPLNRYVVEINVPDAIWREREVRSVQQLPVSWDAIPHGMASIQAGSSWYQRMKSLLLEVPSVIVPEESVLLIHARHPQIAKLSARALRRFDYNGLFRAQI